MGSESRTESETTFCNQTGPRALMHVDDAARRGIADGDQVAVRSLSRLTGVPIKVERSQ